MRLVNLSTHTIVFLLLALIFIVCSKKDAALPASSQIRCDGFYYCVRPDTENVMMVIQFYNDGTLRASQWFYRDGSIGDIANVKNAAGSWLEKCEGFTMCASYHIGGAKIDFDLNFAGIAKVFANGDPIHRSFTGKMLSDGRLSCTWDHDTTRFIFNFISNDNRYPTRSDSLTT